MPHYTIDVNDDGLFVEGSLGKGLMCAKAARLAALKALPDLAKEKSLIDDCHTFSATVRDQSGREVYSATMTLVGYWKVSPPPS